MNPWVIVVMLLMVGAGTATGIRIGMKIERSEAQAREITRADKVIVRLQKEIVIRDRVVKEYVTVTQAIEVKSEEIKDEIPTVVRADCVVPADLLLQLHAISRGVTVADSGADEDQAQGASCRVVAGEINDAYEAHRKVIAQLNKILDWDEAPREGGT